MPDRDSLPSYSDVVAYYLRDDVAAFMWRLCQGRLLKFFHHSAYDLRSEHKTPAGLAFHGVASVADLCQRVRAATANAPSYPYPFFPFWGMQSTAVNVYGAPDRLLGWDMRFEFDFDLAQSFAAVLPVAAVLEHLGVPYVSKFSGHRSLHLLIPAEAFPAGMKARADHAEWMRVFDALGRLFCRLSPYINATSAGLSKEIMLTAPYSLHRYHGLLSLPLSIEQSLRFSPAMAALERFPGVAWPFPDPEDPGLGAQALIDLAARADQSPGALAEVARGAFAGPAWERFNRRVVPGDVEPHSTLGLLMAGASGLGGEKAGLDPRVRLALAAMDDPQNKTYKHLRLIDEVGYVTPFDTYVRQRRANATVLDAWVQGGSARALATVQSILVDPQYKAPLLLALRLYAILPEDAAALLDTLASRRPKDQERSELHRLFFVLAMGQLPGGALRLTEGLPAAADRGALLGLLQAPETWHADAEPEKALAALCLAYGAETVRGWVSAPERGEGPWIVSNVFEGNAKKAQHAARRIGIL